MTTRYGFVGLGNLGRHLAASLVRAGFPLVVHDARPEAAEELVASGAVWSDSPRGVAEQTDAVFTCLPSPAIVDVVVAGKDGVLAGLRPGGTWIDSSTNDVHEFSDSRLSRRGAASTCSRLRSPAVSISPRRARSR